MKNLARRRSVRAVKTPKFDRAIAFYDQSGLKQIQHMPHVYVNASLSAEEFFGVATILP